VPVTASELDGAAVDTAFARLVAKAPSFATYQAGIERRMPVVRLAPRDP
jgi:hypothetical protein